MQSFHDLLLLFFEKLKGWVWVPPPFNPRDPQCVQHESGSSHNLRGLMRGTPGVRKVLMCASQKSDWRYKSWLAVQSTMYNLIGNLHPSWFLNPFFTLFVCFTGNLWIGFLSLTIPGDIWRKSFSGINVAGNVKDDASWCEGASTTGKSHDWSSPSGLPPLAHPEHPQAPPLPPLATLATPAVHPESCACKQHCPNGEEGGASLPYQKINSESFFAHWQTFSDIIIANSFHRIVLLYSHDRMYDQVHR